MAHDEHEPDPTLRRIAEAVADGTGVDWGLAGSAEPELAAKLGYLRTIESISQICPRIGDVHASSVTSSGAPNRSTADVLDEVFAPQSVPLQWGHLLVHERIGTGNFAEVYRATDPHLQREVALKLFKHRSAPRDGFLQEAQRLAQVEHPNLITVFGADVRAGRAGLWTELLSGGTLEQTLRQRGLFSADEAGLVGAELCAALAAIHRVGLVHGDVKASNVLRVEGGRIVLMDFGCVREDGLDLLDASRVGTPLFMAPEVLNGAPPSRAADVYQLGVLLFRLTSDAYPVQADTLDELMAKHARGEVLRLRDRRADTPAAFIEIVERALDPDPARRFTSMGEMERALRGTLNQERPEVSPRLRRMLVASALVGSALLVLLAVRWRDTGKLFAAPPRVNTVLYRVHAGVEEPLGTDSRLRPGDALFMTLQSREDLHVYVLNEASREPGVVNALFPDAGLRLRNPLVGGVAHRLPAETRGEAFWHASPSGGAERILVVATRGRFEELERSITLQQQQAPASPALDAQQAEDLSLRSIQLRKAQPTASVIDTWLQELELRRQRDKDLWFDLLQLEPETETSTRP